MYILSERELISRLVTRITIDKALYLKDTLCLSDESYNRLCKSVSQLQSLKKLRKRARRIDAILFQVNKFNDMIGAWEPLNEKIKFDIKQIEKQYPNELV